MHGVSIQVNLGLGQKDLGNNEGLRCLILVHRGRGNIFFLWFFTDDVNHRNCFYIHHLELLALLRERRCIENFLDVLDRAEYPKGPLALRCFGAAGHHYMETYGAAPDLFAKVAVKTRNHAALNPNALFTAELTVEDVMAAPVLYMDYLTRLMCCPPTCGAGAAIICSEAFAKRHGIEHGVEIVAQAMATDTPATWDNPINLVGADMTRRAAHEVYELAGIGAEEVDVVELHDCFTTNEVITYEGLGLCAEGEATAFVDNGDNTYGGKFVVNPSGGLMSKGHPIGATGLAQCYELVNQLRNTAGQRQVAGARVALQHNLGLGGAAVVTMYRRA